MFGENPVRKQELREDGKLLVRSIFPTLQGEGPYAGRSAIFIRLWGCNLRCWFCDTDFESVREEYSVTALLDEIGRVRGQVPQASLIVLTGGEPLRQNILPLLHSLIIVLGYEVQIETAGTLWVDGLENFCKGKGVTLVCSPKTPRLHPTLLSYCEHYKYIINAHEPLAPDGLPFALTQPGPGKTPLPSLARPPYRGATVWVQPCDEYDEAKNKANHRLVAKLAMQHGYRASLQLHKLLELE